MKRNLPDKKRPETKKVQGKNYSGVDRRKKNDPSYFGYYALEGLERRKRGGFLDQR
jgi:hypothetical protein